MKKLLILVWFLIIPLTSWASFGESDYGDSAWITFEGTETINACTLWRDNNQDTSTWEDSIILDCSGRNCVTLTKFEVLGCWFFKFKYDMGGTDYYSYRPWNVKLDLYDSLSSTENLINEIFSKDTVDYVPAGSVGTFGNKWATDNKSGYSLASSQAFNNTGTWTGNITGSVGSVTGNVGGLNWGGIHNDSAINNFLNTTIDSVTNAPAGGGGGASASEIMDSLRAGGNIAFAGTESCSILVLDENDNAINECQLVIRNTAGDDPPVARTTTNANGIAYLSLDTLTFYRVTAYANLYSQDNIYDTLDVDTGGVGVYDTVKMTYFTPTAPPQPNMVTIWGCVRDPAGVNVAGLRATYYLNLGDSIGYTTDSTTLITSEMKTKYTRTNTSGIWEFSVIRASEIFGTPYSTIIVNLPRGQKAIYRLQAPDQTSYRVRPTDLVGQ